MEGKKQKVSQIRKKEILDAAKRVFLRKGFADTVMEDIIVETSLSRGGVYYHYKNKVEILHDLMREGMAYRVDKINEVLAEYSGELDANAVAHMIVDKVLDESELMSVYAIYLQATKNNDDLKNLFPILVEESLKATYIGVKVAKKDGCEYLTNDFLIFFMNTVILGCEILDGARDSFINNREFFIEIIKLFNKYFQNRLCITVLRLLKKYLPGASFREPNNSSEGYVAIITISNNGNRTINENTSRKIPIPAFLTVFIIFPPFP